MRIQIGNCPTTSNEGWRVNQPKHCVNKKDNADKYPSNVNNVNNELRPQFVFFK